MADLQPITLNPPLNPVLVTDGSGLNQLKSFFDRSDGVIGWDKESTYVKDFYWRKTRTIQFGNVNEQYVIDLLAFVDGDSDLLYNCQGEYGKNNTVKLKPVLDIIRPITCTNKFLKVGVNLSFEYELDYWGFGERPWNFFSCDLAERAIVAGAHSLKNYPYFSLEQMIARYFNKKVDKDLQESFNLTNVLTQKQIEYAALDTRLPLALRLAQLRIIEADNLVDTVQIENNAIGSFVDMHVHGQNLNTKKWIEYDDKKRIELKESIIELDKHFLPLVGSKNVKITDEEINKLENEWKSFTFVTQREIELRKEIRYEKDLDKQLNLIATKNEIERNRKESKEALKSKWSELKKLRTKLNKLIPECEGEALINYGSEKQLLDVLKGIKGLAKLQDTNDKTLDKHTNKPIIVAIRKFREVSKQVNTYGLQWTKTWTTGPKSEEGWLHPGDGKLHCRFNQYDAETGRSSSESPNGQNIPHAEELRSCFEADPSDEEDYVLVTADMSGAELRIIAELAGAKTWIEAFDRDEDVHSVGTEILYPDRWPGLALPGCAYYKLRPDGTAYHLKCKCPEHKKLRDGTKEVNFKIAYGGTEYGLAQSLKIPVIEARDLLNLHRSKFPDVWDYLEESGKQAKIKKEARSMFGRRRLFLEPTWELAKQKAKEDRENQHRFDKKVYQVNINNFIAVHNRKPLGSIKEIDSEYYFLTHRPPTDAEISNAYAAMYSSMERQGKNHPIQAGNADIAKIACGCGYDKNNKPFLWHLLPQYKAKLIAFIHDEFLVQCPARYGQQIADLIGDAFLRAGAERMTKVQMKFSYEIAHHWKKY